MNPELYAWLAGGIGLGAVVAGWPANGPGAARAAAAAAVVARADVTVARGRAALDPSDQNAARALEAARAYEAKAAQAARAASATGAVNTPAQPSAHSFAERRWGALSLPRKNRGSPLVAAATTASRSSGRLTSGLQKWWGESIPPRTASKVSSR